MELADRTTQPSHPSSLKLMEAQLKQEIDRLSCPQKSKLDAEIHQEIVHALLIFKHLNTRL
jgi:hypothetical protein